MIARLRSLLFGGRRASDVDDDRIRREGHPGRGTVVAVSDTGRRRHDERVEVDLELDVYLGRSRAFRVEIRPWVTPAERRKLIVGRAVPVAADPADPGHVVLAFEWDEPVSIDGLGPVAGGPGGPPIRRRRPEPGDDR